MRRELVQLLGHLAGNDGFRLKPRDLKCISQNRGLLERDTLVKGVEAGTGTLTLTLTVARCWASHVGSSGFRSQFCECLRQRLMHSVNV